MDNKDKGTEFRIRRLLEGGYVVTHQYGADVFASDSIDRALWFIRENIQPVQVDQGEEHKLGGIIRTDKNGYALNSEAQKTLDRVRADAEFYASRGRAGC